MSSIASTSHNKNYLVIGLSIFLTVALLFSLDKDIHGPSDLFRLGNLVGSMLYFLPTFFICMMLYRVFLRRNDRRESLYLSLVAGIPTGIVSVIVILRVLISVNE
jgi:F0F1-type ATP synthase assembly protein I